MSAVSVPGLADPAAAAGAGGKRTSRWSDLRTRTLSAVLLGPAVLACIWLGGPLWLALIAVAAVGLGVEWTQLCGRKPLAWPAVILPAVLCAGGVAAALGYQAEALLALAAGALVLWLAGRSPVLAAGVVYAGLPLMALAWLRGGDASGRADVVFLVVVVWASDIGAYLAGRLLGGPKLAPSISPGKTWSGALGGLVAAMLVGEVAAQLLVPTVAWRAALVACALGVVSQAGDLLESALKRHFGVKDSGWLIPGHGGLLDRLDGLLAAALAASILMNTGLLGRGGVLWN